MTERNDTNGYVLDFGQDGAFRSVGREGIRRSLDFAEDVPAFRIHTEKNGERQTLLPRHFARVELSRPSGEVVDQVFSHCEGWPGLTVRIRFSFVGDEVRLRIGLSFDPLEGSMVRELDAPVVPVPFHTGVDRILIPSDKGDLLLDPARQLTANGYRGHARFVYPGCAAMQYTEVYNRDEGVYFAAYNMGDESFDIGYEVPNGPAQPEYHYDPTQVRPGTVNLFHRYYPFLESGKWFSPTIALALHKGDWHAGADLYRAVMDRLLARPERPRWMDHGEGFHGWVKAPLLSHHDAPAHIPFRNIPKLLDRVLDAGLRVLCVAGWSGIRYDSRCPDGTLNTQLGTEEDFREAIREIHRRGGKILLYGNGRAVDDQSEFYRQGGDREVVIHEDGTAPRESWFPEIPGSTYFLVACPSSDFFRKYLADQFEYAMALGADAVQDDQVSMAPAIHCFDQRHDHTKPSNNWIRGAEQLCRETKLAYRSGNPDAFAWIEGVHERFGQYYEVSQSHGEVNSFIVKNPDGSNAPGYPEMFRYTFPSYCVTGVADGQAVRTMLQGKPFDVNDSWLAQDEANPRQIRAFVALRQRYPEFYLRGRFLDTTGFSLEYGPDRIALQEGVYEPVMARAIESEDGRRLLIGIWNKRAERLPVRLTVAAKYAGPLTRVLPAEGAPESLAETGGPYDLELRDELTLWIKG